MGIFGPRASTRALARREAKSEGVRHSRADARVDARRPKTHSRRSNALSQRRQCRL